jgi:hypothetical protein
VLPGLVREAPPNDHHALVLVSAMGRDGFRATMVPLDAEGTPYVSQLSRDALGVAAGDRVMITPLP